MPRFQHFRIWDHKLTKLKKDNSNFEKHNFFENTLFPWGALVIIIPVVGNHICAKFVNPSYVTSRKIDTKLNFHTVFMLSDNLLHFKLKFVVEKGLRWLNGLLHGPVSYTNSFTNNIYRGIRPSSQPFDFFLLSQGGSLFYHNSPGLFIQPPII